MRKAFGFIFSPMMPVGHPSQQGISQTVFQAFGVRVTHHRQQALLNTTHTALPLRGLESHRFLKNSPPNLQLGSDPHAPIGLADFLRSFAFQDFKSVGQLMGQVFKVKLIGGSSPAAQDALAMVPPRFDRLEFFPSPPPPCSRQGWGGRG